MIENRDQQQNFQFPKIPAFWKNPVWLTLAFTGVAMTSASLGGLLAIALASTPLQQHKFRGNEATVFNNQRLASSSLGMPKITRPINILVLGMSVLSSDLGQSDPQTKTTGYEPEMHSVEGLADTIVLLRFDPSTDQLTVLSIPRDTRIVLEKYGNQKINATNVIGGPALAAQEGSKLLNNVTIDRYLRVNVLAVGHIVDAIGGLNLYIPKDMKYKDDTQHLYVNLKQGQQHLNGDQTMQLLRFRHDENGDIGRIQRQQIVMRALMAQALNPTTIAEIPQLLQTIKSDIDTNMSIEEILALVGFAASTNRQQVLGLIVPGTPNGNGRKQISYWLPDRERIQVMVGKYFNQGQLSRYQADPATVRVSIQDSSKNSQAVTALVKKLTAAGYHHVSIDTPLPEPLSATQIVAQQGDTDSASAISKILGFGEVRVETNGAIYSDVTIQLGTDGVEKR